MYIRAPLVINRLPCKSVFEGYIFFLVSLAKSGGVMVPVAPPIPSISVKFCIYIPRFFNDESYFY